MAIFSNLFTRKSNGDSQILMELASQGTTPISPRKVPTGTSYNAKGLIEPPVLDSELGSTQPTRIIDIVPELVSPLTRALTYARMMYDAGVDVSVRAVKTPILGAEFYMEPYSDDPQDVLVSDFVKDNLMGGMSDPFLSSLEDILRFFEDGYSVLEKVYELRDWTPNASGANSKTYTMLKSLGIRPATTLGTPTYDNNGRLVSLQQNAVQGDGSVTQVDLPANKLLWFTFNRKGGDITGKSILRTAYPHWYYKTHLYKIDAIQKERHALGVPRGKLLPGYNKNDLTLLRTMLRNIRTNEEAFFIQPPNIEVDFAKVEGNLVNVLESASHHNQMILLNVMAAFLALGLENGSGGGRSVSATQTDMFLKALRYVANYIADTFNMFLIPELVVYNFPTRNFPKLQVRNMGETRDLQMLGAAIANVLAQGGIQMDDPTENWIRRVFDMPLKSQSQSQQQDTQPTSGSQNGKQKGNIKPGRATTGNNGKPPNAPQ